MKSAFCLLIDVSTLALPSAVHLFGSNEEEVRGFVAFALEHADVVILSPGRTDSRSRHCLQRTRYGLPVYFFFTPPQNPSRSRVGRVRYSEGALSFRLGGVLDWRGVWAALLPPAKGLDQPPMVSWTWTPPESSSLALCAKLLKSKRYPKRHV